MELTELQAAALKARPAEIVHHAGGRTVFYEIDPRFDPEEWKYALMGVSIASGGCQPARGRG